MSKSIPVSLENATAEITSTPSVEGVAFYTNETEVVHSYFSKPGGEQHLDVFLKGTTSLLNMSNQLNMECQSVECDFKNLTAFTYQIDEHHLISVFFDRTANKRIVKMTLLSQLTEIRKELSAWRVAESIDLTRPRNRDYSGQIKIRPSLKPRLDIIRNALQMALNDRAGDQTNELMEKSIRKWATLGPVNKKELPVLADILSKSIAGEERQKQFFEDIEDTFLGIR
ncbi:MAG: hypothetical protein CSB24_03270 [Deltaproteobacteria bacterium]|nr:MAG: hypothetical protein CSB24_03270 [Deltaproteobacteria bacterium]